MMPTSVAAVICQAVSPGLSQLGSGFNIRPLSASRVSAMRGHSPRVMSLPGNTRARHVHATQFGCALVVVVCTTRHASTCLALHSAGVLRELGLMHAPVRAA